MNLHEINLAAAISRCVPHQNDRVFNLVVDMSGRRTLLVRFVCRSSLESTDPLVGLTITALEEEAFKAFSADGHCRFQSSNNSSNSNDSNNNGR